MMKTIMLYGALLTMLWTGAAEWKFDDRDALPGSRGEWTLAGSGRWEAESGVAGGAWRFDGVKDYLSLDLSGESRPWEEMTVAFWVKPEPGSEVFQAVRQAARDVSFDGGPGFGWYEVHTASGAQIYNGYAHPQRLKYGEWYHFALVYDQSGLGFYLDGELIGRADCENGGELRCSGQPWHIGGRLYGDQAGFFKGLMDELEISNRARHAFPRVKALKRALRLRALLPENSQIAAFVRRAAAADEGEEALWEEAQALSRTLLAEIRRERMRAAFGAAAAGLPFAVMNESALTRILPDDFFPGTAGPVTITSAANERENVQLLVLPYEGRIDYTLELPSTLRREDGLEAPFDFRVARINYPALPKPSPYMYPLAALPEQLYYDRDFSAGDRELAPLWLEVFTPSGTPPGVYSGQIGVSGFELPVTVKVWNFQLPRRNIVPSLVNIWERDLSSYLEEGDVDGFLELYKAYGAILLEHRLNPVVLAHTGLVAPWVRQQIYPDYRVEDGAVVANMACFDELVAYFRALGLSKVAIGPHYNFDETRLSGGDWWSNIQATQPEKIWRFVRNHAAEKGYLDDAVAYAVDEPEDDLVLINRVSGMLKGAAPGLDLLLTSGGANYPDPAIRDVDIWVPILHWTNFREKARRQAEGRPVWSYVCTGPNYPYPNLHADTPGAGIRMLPLTLARFGYDGFLHWAANFNTYKGAPTDQPNAFAAGEGTYIFADAEGRPVPTVRLKYLADGMEDWTMLLMLCRRDPEGFAAVMGKLAQLLPEAQREWPEVGLKDPPEASFRTALDMQAFYNLYDHPEGWLALRDEIGERLSALSGTETIDHHSGESR